MPKIATLIRSFDLAGVRVGLPRDSPACIRQPRGGTEPFMSLRQDRLTFFGVLIAVVVAVLGYLQLGSMYPVEGRADDTPANLNKPAPGDAPQHKTPSPGGAGTHQGGAIP